MYPLKNADVRNTVIALQDLFVKSAARGQRAGADTGQIAVTGDDTGRVVVVSAPKEKHELIAKVINELDQAQDADKVTVKVYRLVNADASTVASALQSTVETSAAAGGARGQAGAGGQVRLSADRSSNSLVVRASAADHEKIGKLIQEMDITPTDQYAVRLIPLNTGDATSIAQVLNRLFVATATTGGRGASSVRPAVAIEADAGSRLLAVRADDPTFEKIKALAMQLDTVAPTATPVLIPLKYATATTVAAAVGTAFALPRAGKGPINPDDLVTVAAEPVSNSLLVTANAANLAKVQALVKQMDVEETGGIRTELVIMKFAKSADMAPILTRMVQASPASSSARGGPSVVVTADAGSNGLVISGPAGELDKVLKMATQLDQATSSSATQVRIISLKNGDATTVAAMVKDLYSQQVQVAQRERKSLDPLAVSSDVRANAIVLATSDTMFQQVSEWVNQIEVMQPARGTLKIITLQHADPTEVQKAIEQLYGTPGATGMPVVPIRRGPRGALGTTGPTTPGGKVETSVLPQQRSILINASDEDFETIQKLAEALDAAAADARLTLRVFALKNTNNAHVALALTNLYRAVATGRPVTPGAPPETVTVTALPDTNAVVVAASKDRMEEVAHLIQEMDKVEIAPQLEFRIFPLTNAQPTKLMPVLTQMLAQLKQTRPDEPINVQADERTKSLIVTARGPMFEPIEKIIKTLDKPAAHAESEVLIIPLKKADATRLAAVLTEMLQPSAANLVTPEARALQEQVRLLRVRSTAGDEVPELDLTKPIKITADPNVAGQQGSNALVISSTPDNLKAMRAIVGILDSVPVAEGAKVRIHHLENADAASVVTVLKDIFAQGKTLGGKPRTSVEGRAEPESASGKALVNPFNVSADERTNTIVMSGIEESLALADLIVKDLDRDAGKVVTEVRLFRLKNADVTRLVPMLQAVFMETAPTPGSEGLRTQVTRLRTVLEKQTGHVSEVPKTRAALTIQADPTTSIVVVAARADMMPLIADIINTMDVPGAGSMNCVRIYPLVNADATRLKTVIDGLYTGPNATLVRAEDKPVVQVDTRTNALVISASDKTFAMLTTLLANLDTKTPIEMRDIKIVNLKNADATALGTALQRMMDARVQRLAVISPADAEALRVIIIPDTRSNSLMVGGSAEGFQLVKSLAEQLDATSPGLTGQIQLYPMKHANAPVVATTLSAFFTQRYAAARTTDVARERPVIMSDVRCNCLLVAANADDTKIIISLLEKLDVELPDPSVQLVVIPLKFNDAGIVGPKLQQIFQARLTSMTLPGQQPVPQDRVDVSSDGLSNALIISASKENLVLIKGLLDKLDVEPPDVTGVVRMYPLQNSDAQRIQTMLQGLIQQGLYKPGAAVAQGSPLLAAREKISITVDVRTNVLIVSASKENFAVIEEIIKKLDSSEDYGLLGDIHLFTLKNADATRLAPTLQQLFTAKRAAETAAGGTGRMLPVSVFADARTNTLLVTGSKESFNAVEAMVRELDTDQILASNEFRIFYLKQATATVIAPTLTQLFAQRVARGGVKEPVTIVTEGRTNSLIVSASPDDLKVAESLINRLDAEPDRPGTAMQVFPIAKADATQVANTLKSLYTTQGAAAAGTPTVVVSVDERINAVVVSAGPADLKRIGELVRELDTDTVPRVTEIRVFTLENADATELAQILTDALNNKPKPLTQTSPNRQSLLQFITRSKEGAELISSALQEGVLITPDKRTNSLVISAPVENMPLLESLVKAMDSTSPRTAQIRVITLINADARQMATVLQQLFRMQGAAGGGAAAGAGKQAIRYTLIPKTEDGKDAPSAVLGSAEEAALTVTVDVRTNSLLVGGTKHYVDLATKVVDELDASTASERLTEVYRLRNAKAQDIQVALTNFLTQERTYVTQSLTATGGGGTTGGAQILLEREVAIVAEPVSNTLLLSASPRYFDVIATIIQELDQPPPQVLIQVLLAEVTLSDSTQFGIDWNFTHLFGKNNVSVGTNFGMQAAAAGTGFGVSVTGGDISAFMRALESQGRVEVLSRPQILASDNQHAIINVGQRVPFITNSTITQYGGTVNTIQYQQIGIILDVTPRINPDGFVKLEVKPEISSLSKSSDVQVVPNVPAVIIDNRTAETTVTVQDGHTIVIGGLITTNDNKTENKVPILGDIPVIGWLFKSTSVQKDRKELLIILTPTVLRNVEESDTETQGQVKRLNLIRESRRDPMQESLFKNLNSPADTDDDAPRVPKVRSSQGAVKPAAPAPPKEAAAEPRKP
jgi:type II secretion system protein D